MQTSDPQIRIEDMRRRGQTKYSTYRSRTRMRHTFIWALVGVSFNCLVGAGGAAQPVGETVIVAFGDSFTAGLGLPREAAFPARLQDWLASHGRAARVVNAGVSGETTAMALKRVDAVMAQRPSMVILELGANDALRGVQPAVTKRNLRELIARIRAVTPNILFTGMRAPTNWGEEYRRAFDQIYPEIAAADWVPLYPFFLDGVALNPSLNQPDGLHPNQQGVQTIVENIGPVIVAAFPQAGLRQETPIAPLTRPRLPEEGREHGSGP